MFEIKSISYEEARAEHFKALMKKMERKIDYWQSRGQYSLKPGGELSRANVECSEAGMQYSFYKDALEALENNKFQYETGFVKGFEAAQPKWISVEDELPPVGERVLACIGRCVVYEGFINCNDKWFRTTGGYEFVGGVTHWMPLPEAPKEEA